MAYSDYQAERIRQRLHGSGRVEEKEMMGGLAFMLNGHMCMGLNRDRTTGEDRLMIRVDKDRYEELLKMKGCREMDFTGKPMRGFLFVYPEGYDLDEDLDSWTEQALAFNRTLAPK